MDYEDGCGKHLKPNRHASNKKHVTFSPLIVVNGDPGGGRRPDSETNLKGITPGSAKSSDSSDTVSSSSASSSSDDFVLVNPQILPKSRGENNIPQPNGGTKPLHKNKKVDVSSEASFFRLEESINESSESTSQFTDVTHESSVAHMLPTLSPSIQVMERHEGSNPNRIPASVFSSPSTPMEWSKASNDSLFSIRIGNNSFSRNYVSKMGVDLHKSEEIPKSGELFKSGELCQSGEPFKSRELSQSAELHKSRELDKSTEHSKASDLKRSCELIRFSQTSPTTKGVKPYKKLDTAKTIGVDMNPREKGMVNEPIKDVSKALMNQQIDTNIGDFRDSTSAKVNQIKLKLISNLFSLPM